MPAPIQVIREYICDWPARDVRALNEEYRALGLMKELTASAAAARPLASSCQQDLCELYQSRYCADVDLVYQGCVFSVHRSASSGVGRGGGGVTAGGGGGSCVIQCV